MKNKVIRIEHDQDAECPMEWDGQWTLHSFSNRSIHYRNPDEMFATNARGEHYAKIGLRRKLDCGLAFMLDYYEHGQGMYSLHGEGMQCRWGTSRYAGILVWMGKPSEMGAKTLEDRAKDARGFLETYNNWMNGSVYGFIIEDEEGEHIDSCFGFYDKETLLDAIKENLDAGDCVQLEGDAKYMIDECDLPNDVAVVDEFRDADYVYDA